MTPLLPELVGGEACREQSLAFDWDESNSLAIYDHDEPGLWPRLSVLTIRAQFALALACGEWVCYGFSAVSDISEPVKVIEAGWAALVHRDYAIMREPDADNWRGPDRSPLHIVMLIIADCFNALDEDPDGASRAVWMYNVAMRVLDHNDVFEAWFQQVVARLEDRYRKDPNEQQDIFSELPPGMGKPVPRQVFNTRLPAPDDDAPLIDRYLQDLDPKQNEFLASAADIEGSSGFEGVPYRYQPT
jgi:hypothetical protein